MNLCYRKSKFNILKLPQLEFETDLEKATGLFVKIDSSQFLRMVSNLIDNAVEALPNSSGKVVISVRKYGEIVSTIVQDNGKGIPENLISQVGVKGITFGKSGKRSGNGLGVWHAKPTIESAGGSFHILSKEGHGTQVLLSLPLSSESQRTKNEMSNFEHTTV